MTKPWASMQTRHVPEDTATACPSFYAVQTSISRLAGGLFFSVRHLLDGLAEVLASEVTVLSIEDSYAAEDMQSWNKVRIKLFPGFLGDRGLSPQLVLYALKHFCSRDVIYINGVWSFVLLAGRIAQRRGAAVVVAPRGMLDPWILRKNRLFKMIFFGIVGRPLLRRSFACHALNDSEAEAIRALVPDANIFVCPNGVPVPPNVPPLHASPERRFVYIGRLDAKKGLLEFIQVMDQLEDINWRLTIYGWGNVNYAHKLKQMVEVSKHRDRIDILPPVYGEEKSRALASAHFFVLPSKSEGLPMAAIEALAAGRPILVTEECNFDREVMTSNACLPLGPIGNWIHTLRQAVTMSDEDLWRRCLEAHALAGAKFEIGRVTGRMRDLFHAAYKSCRGRVC